MSAFKVIVRGNGTAMLAVDSRSPVLRRLKQYDAARARQEIIRKRSFGSVAREAAGNLQLSASSSQTEGPPACLQDEQLPGMTPFLDSLKWNTDGLVAVIVQHVDTGEVLMQAYADRAAVSETLQTRLATFYSRSRKERWCKGETSGHYIHVTSVHPDCDRDSIVYMGDPIGPACHTGAASCWFSKVGSGDDGSVSEVGQHESRDEAPLSTLLALERTIQHRREDAGLGGKSWTAKLLGDPELLCKKVREEAGELCQTLEAAEGRERAASEAADLLYHSLVLLNVQGVPLSDVLKVLRGRFGVSGIAEKASRRPTAGLDEKAVPSLRASGA